MEAMLSKLPPMLALFALAAVACLPKPEEPIEWLQREDAVIVQMRTSGEEPAVLGAPLLEVPELTLYGDGRLIVRLDGANGEASVLEAQVGDGAIEDMLEEIEGSGYFNFPYPVAGPGGENGGEATYFYVNTKLVANATGAQALQAVAPEDDEWKQFRRLQSLSTQLVEFAQDQLADGEASAYQPEAVLLIVQPVPPNATSPSFREWPFEEIDLAALLSDEEIATRRVDGEAGREVAAFVDEGGGKPINERRFTYSLTYRPLLPFEEHFPEFETPQ